jgi:hypothetical protein
MIADATWWIEVQGVCTILLALFTGAYVILTWFVVKRQGAQLAQARKVFEKESAERLAEERRRRDRSVLAIHAELGANQRVCAAYREKGWTWGERPALLVEQYAPNAWALAETQVDAEAIALIGQAYAWVKAYNLALQATGTKGQSNAEGLISAAEKAWFLAGEALSQAVTKLTADLSRKGILGKSGPKEQTAVPQLPNQTG